MLTYNREDIKKLEEKYPEFTLKIEKESPFVGEDREIILVSHKEKKGSLKEGLEDPRRKALVKEIKGLSVESDLDWNKSEEIDRVNRTSARELRNILGN